MEVRYTLRGMAKHRRKTDPRWYSRLWAWMGRDLLERHNVIAERLRAYEEAR